MNQVAGVLATSTDTYLSDDDPQLIREALPFTLKLMEGTLAETPRHRGLLLQTCASFTQYAYGFIKFDADVIEDDDYKASKKLNQRAKKLFLRARDYCLRGMALRHRDVGLRLRKDPLGTAARLDIHDVEMAYWVAAAWGSAISVGKDDAELIADQVVVEALFDRLLELDPDFDQGAVHEAMISYEMARQGGEGKPEDRARAHFARAIELSQGHRAAPYVSLAESVALQLQNKKEFEALLAKALAVEVDKYPSSRCLNLVMQDRARWLLSLKDDLFIE
jgi:predicted anti-sigma-YlaC factor YlaD